MPLILVRHTRPAVSQGVCYGRLDLQLAATWPQEFEACLARIPTASRVLSSPASRCLRLAQALGRRDGVEVQLDARLQELDFGAWEGRGWDDIPREDIDAWVVDQADYAPGRGESLRMLWERVGELRRSLMGWQDPAARRGCLDGGVVVVSHHGPIRAWIAQAAGRSMQSMLAYQVEWGAVVTIDADGVVSEPEPPAPR